ncbi:MAG TPA: TonB-dependent receptor, partial [Puia sp.]|nr:TonB-dependent receptor [Puia sp.]
MNVVNHPFRRMLKKCRVQIPAGLLLLLLPSLLFAQNKRITGTVTDSANRPLPGATVHESQKNATTTDENGKFTLTLKKSSSSIIVSYVGFVTREMNVKAGSNLSIQLLSAASAAMKDVVVVGYGTQSKAKITGAVSVVTGDELRKMPVTNNTLSLAGKVPGLISLNSSGAPGSASSISIRGVSSYNDAPPLYVIDGTIRSAANFAQIDPNEIESISVLKDAGSAAVYGVRATNGVIVVTTKRGKSGKPVFSLNSDVSFDRPTRYPHVLDAYQYTSLMNTATENMGNSTHPYTDQQVAEYKSGQLPSTDWQKLAFKTSAVTEQENLNISGGSDAIRYFFSFGYLNQNGIYSNLTYGRYNFRSNLDIRINKTLSAAINLEGTVAKNAAPNVDQGTLFQRVNGSNPTTIAFYPDGRPHYDIFDDMHPVEVTKESGYNKTTDNLFVGQAALTQQLPFISGLSLKGSIQVWRETTFNKDWNLQYDTYVEDANANVTQIVPLGTKTTLFEQMAPYNSYTLDLSMDYARTFGKHTVKGLLLYEQYQAEADTLNASRTDYPVTSVDQLFAGGNDPTQMIYGSAAQDGRLSVVGRLDYDYDAKYLFEASFRNDASYRFAPNKRWGFFPSASAGWVLSKEDFMKDVKAVNFLKLRGSYGILGNDIVGGFQWESAYNIAGNYYFSNTAVEYLVPSVVPNPDLTWERTATGNIGLDAMMWNKLLGITFDVFQKNTYDVYGVRNNQYPGVYGATLPSQNYGKVDVRGFELALTHENTIGPVRYTIGGNISFSRNKVVRIDYTNNIEPWNNPTGKPINYRIGYVAEGLYQSDADAMNSAHIVGVIPKAGDIKYKDLNGDGIIDSRDNSVLSWNNSTPEVMYGFTMDLSYKGFDLNVFFQGVAHRNVNYSGYTRDLFANGTSNSYNYFLDSWSPTNTGAKFPRAWIGSNPENDQNSSYWLQNGDFLRLKNLQLAYNVPKRLIGKWGFSNLRFFVSGTNLAVFSKIKDFDPELPEGNGFYYPQNKSLVVGASISF